MSLFGVFGTAGSAMNAQSIRLNVTASNLANADSVSGDQNAVYRAQNPVFTARVDESDPDSPATGVDVTSVERNPSPLQRQYRPDHPSADPEGYVFAPNVNVMDEMANMISASRSYQNNVEVMSTAKEMLLRTLNLGR